VNYLIKCIGVVLISFSGWQSVMAAENAKPRKSPVVVPTSDINVTNAFFYVPLGSSKTTMAFFTISNNSNSDITITGVSSSLAKQVRLMPAETLLVPAHQSVALKASGQYLQINELKTKLSTGDELHLTVSLSNGKKLQLMLVAKSAYDEVHGR
jgi:copper(I)-binding protein